MQKIFSYILGNNPVKDWVVVIVAIAVFFILIQLAKKTLLKQFKKWAASTDGTLDDFVAQQLAKIAVPFLKLMTVWLSLSYLTFNATAEKWIKTGMLIMAIFLVLKFVTAAIKYIIQRSMQGQENIEIKMKQARGIILIINFVVWVAGFIFLLNNLGYNVTSIIAGLGIGGIAIALAAQAILGDLFSYFVIFFDKPFEMGDFINVDDKSGTIEYIGLKTTRVRTLSGEQLVFSNQDLTSSRLHNFKRMEKRRIVFSVGVVYETLPDKLKQIPGMIKAIIERLPDTSFDRSHFTTFGDFSLNFETSYYIMSSDYIIFRDRQQEINLSLFNTFLKEGIDFAYPTQTVIMQSNTKNTTFKEDRAISYQH